MTESVKIETTVVDKVRDVVKETKQSIGGYFSLAAQEKMDGGIFKKIKDDKELYYAWQANIAMSFKDEYSRWKKRKKAINSEAIHEIANKAAKDFLDLLTK